MSSDETHVNMFDMNRRIPAAATAAVQSFHDDTRDDTGLSPDAVLLKDAAVLRDALEAITHRRAYDAHSRGMTWQQIGDLLGVTRQTASKTYAPIPRVVASATPTDQR